jgi:hypothetical protein
MRTKGFLKSRDQRKRVEMRFAHLKIHHGFERMRLRGLSGARDEFLLAATVQSLPRLVSSRMPHRVAPSHHSVAILLDLVNPVHSRRRLVGGRW